MLSIYNKYMLKINSRANQDEVFTVMSTSLQKNLMTDFEQTKQIEKKEIKEFGDYFTFFNNKMKLDKYCASVNEIIKAHRKVH